MFEETVQPAEPPDNDGGSSAEPQNDSGASDNGGTGGSYTASQAQ
jgi:hypothetical protein